MEFEKSKLFDRRFLLKGAGVSIALPLLESLSGAESGSTSSALQELPRRASLRSGGPGSPLSPDG